MRLYCATGNPGKLREFRMLAGGIELVVPHDFTSFPPPQENGATFEANAILKAVYYGRRVSGLLFAEDSGLEVDALGGAPGVRSARFAGPDADDEANNRLLLARLLGVGNRAARYRCAIALVRDASLLRTFEGAVEGRILDESRGTGGFGYDPLFYYPPLGRTFAELPLEEKNARSHRSEAFRKLLAFLL